MMLMLRFVYAAYLPAHMEALFKSWHHGEVINALINASGLDNAEGKTPAKAEEGSTWLEQMCICSLKAIDSSITVPDFDSKRWELRVHK